MSQEHVDADEILVAWPEKICQLFHQLFMYLVKQRDSGVEI